MSSKHPRVSIVIPAYNEEPNLLWHHDQIKQFIAGGGQIDEICYVDDGSIDQSLEVIKHICAKDPTAKYISLSRNFGKEAALSAGLREVTGDVVIAVDADGQYPLETIPIFLEEWHKGADVVVGVRNENASDTFVQRLGSRSFYKLLKLVGGGGEVISKATDFRLLDRRVVDEYNKLTERNRIARNLIDWLGFKRTYVSFDAPERHGGEATYNISKKLKLAGDGIIKHSTRPLKLIGGIGVLVSLLSIIAAILLIIEKYGLDDPMHLAVTGTAILALLLSFLIGIVLVCQGLLALYLENVYHETQNRPLYIIREKSA